MLQRSPLFIFIFSLLLSACGSFENQDTKEADLHLRIGVSHLNQGNYPQALKELLAAEKLDPENPVVQNNLGLAYFVRERFDLAEKHISKAIALKEDYTEARNNLATVYIEQGQLDKALVQAQKTVNDLTYSTPEKAQNTLGIIYFKKSNFKTAKVQFQKALQYQPDNCTAASYYGRTLYELKDLKKSAEALDQASRLCQRSQFDEPHYYSALAYYKLGDVEKSESRLEELLKLYPQGKYLDKAKDMLENLKR